MSYPQNRHDFYHAHVYFCEESCEFAKALRESIFSELNLKVGNFNCQPVGPHTKWSFEVHFKRQEFERLIPWLEQRRAGHSVLVHAVTGDDLLDHTEFAYWLGHPVPLKLALFQ